MARYDSLDMKYKPIIVLNKYTNRLFWISAFLSLVLYYLRSPKEIAQFFTIIYIVATIAYFSISSVLNIYLIPRVENMRRRHLLSNSFGIALDTEVTHCYYNNNLDPSIIKLGANILENSFFAKSVTARMLVFERTKVVIYLIIWIIAMLLRDVDINLISIVAQTLFTSTIISNYLRLESLRAENERIWEELYSLYLTKGISSNIMIPKILDNVIRYEAAKAYSGIIQSTRIFNKLNEDLSLQWNDIRSNLNI